MTHLTGIPKVRFWQTSNPTLKKRTTPSEVAYENLESCFMAKKACVDRWNFEVWSGGAVL